MIKYGVKKEDILDSCKCMVKAGSMTVEQAKKECKKHGVEYTQ